MTPEQQRIAIAEWCGWNMVEGIRAFPPKEVIDQLLNVYPEIMAVDHMEIPDYLNDLNAIHEVESFHVEPHFIEEYAEQLYMVVERFWTADRWLTFSRMGINYALSHATAAQRSEALLRTIGKWIYSPQERPK